MRKETSQRGRGTRSGKYLQATHAYIQAIHLSNGKGIKISDRTYGFHSGAMSPSFPRCRHTLVPEVDAVLARPRLLATFVMHPALLATQLYELRAPRQVDAFLRACDATRARALVVALSVAKDQRYMGRAQSASSHLDMSKVDCAPFCYLCGSSSTPVWLDRLRAMPPICWMSTRPCTVRLRSARTRAAGRASPTQGSRCTPVPAPRTAGTACPPRSARVRAGTARNPRCTAPRGTLSCGSRRTVWKAAAGMHRHSHSRMRSPD